MRQQGLSMDLISESQQCSTIQMMFTPRANELSQEECFTQCPVGTENVTSNMPKPVMGGKDWKPSTKSLSPTLDLKSVHRHSYSGI